jgi:hypothetical protein
MFPNFDAAFVPQFGSIPPPGSLIPRIRGPDLKPSFYKLNQIVFK